MNWRSIKMSLNSIKVALSPIMMLWSWIAGDLYFLLHLRIPHLTDMPLLSSGDCSLALQNIELSQRKTRH